MILSRANELLWRLAAFVVSRPAVADYLIKRAQRTPYTHLPFYMHRWWLFNAYEKTGEGDDHVRRFNWLPSIRIHHILREDHARDMHDHPWNARTIILKGDYDEERMEDYVKGEWAALRLIRKYHRQAGDTARLMFGEYHNITRVSEGGVWTLFFTWKYMGTWGFWVNGKKVPHKEYNNGGAA